MVVRFPSRHELLVAIVLVVIERYELHRLDHQDEARSWSQSTQTTKSASCGVVRLFRRARCLALRQAGGPPLLLQLPTEHRQSHPKENSYNSRKFP